MGNNKESKKGFWSTLFAPKKKSCCCNNNIIVEDDVKPFQSYGCSADSTESVENSCYPTPSETKVSEILILGPGCAKCKETYKVVERVISENSIDVRLSKVEDITEMMKYNIMATPAVVIDGTVKIKGHIPSAEEVKKVLGI